MKEKDTPYGNGVNGHSCKGHLKPESWENDIPKAGLQRCRCGQIRSMTRDGKALSA